VGRPHMHFRQLLGIGADLTRCISWRSSRQFLSDLCVKGFDRKNRRGCAKSAEKIHS
jgi:hypothetical protein